MKNTVGFPWWVKLGLTGIESRKRAFMVFWFCIGAAVSSFFLRRYNILFDLGSLFLIFAFWYWACIKWVDRNAAWEEE